MTSSEGTSGGMPDITSHYSLTPEQVSGGEVGDSSASDAVEAAPPVDALGEARKQLARTQIELAATRQGVDISGMVDYVNVDAFLSEDGSVKADAVKAFVESVAPKVVDPGFSQEVFKQASYRGSGEPYADLNAPQNFKNMSKAQIAAVVASGRLDNLVRR